MERLQPCPRSCHEVNVFLPAASFPNGCWSTGSEERQEGREAAPGAGTAGVLQGSAMVTSRRDAERRASSPRWGTGKQRGQWGRRGCAASPRCPTLLLCPICELPGIALAAGTPRRQRAAGGGLLPWGTPPKKNTARLGGAGGKRLQLPRAALGCRKGVQMPCIGQTQPAVSQGIFSRLMFLFLYFIFFFL